MRQDRAGIESDIRRHYWVKWLVIIALIAALLGLYWVGAKQGISPFGSDLGRNNGGAGSAEASPAIEEIVAPLDREADGEARDEAVDLSAGVPSNLEMGFTAVPGTAIDLVLDGQRLGRAQVGRDGVWLWTGNDGKFSASPGNRGQLPSTFNWESIQNGEISAESTLSLNGIGIPNGSIVLSVGNEQLGTIPIADDGRWSFEGQLPADLPLGEYVLVGNVFDASGIVSLDDQHALPFTLTAAENGETSDAEAIEENEASDSASLTTAAEPTDDAATEEDVAEPEPTQEPTVEAEASADTDDEAGGGGAIGLLDMASQMGGLEILIEAAQITGFDETLRNGGEFTVFAPTDQAFASLPEAVTTALLSNAEAIQLLLQHHVVGNEVGSAELFGSSQKLATVGATEIDVIVDNGAITVGGAQLLSVDNIAENGVIHIIDSVLLPPSAIAKPEIDSSGIAEFKGEFLTIVGMGEPESTLIVELNGDPFGQTFVGDDGSWLVAAPITPGDYEIIAYSLTGALELAVSEPITLTVIE